MKKLLLALMFVPLVSFGQTNPAANLGKGFPKAYNIKNSFGTTIGTLEEQQSVGGNIGWDYMAAARATAEATRIAKERNATSQAARNTYSNNNYNNKSYAGSSSSGTDYTYYNSGSDKFAAKDYEGAVKDLTKFITQNRWEGLGWRRRGTYKTWLNDWKGACYDWKVAAELGDDVAQKKLLKNCNFDGSIKKTASDWHAEGFKKFEQYDYSGAISDFTKAIELNPDDADAYYFRGIAKSYLKDMDGAISDFTKAIELNPDDDDAYSHRGSSKYNLEDYYGAIADYTKAIELKPSALNYNNRAALKSKSGDPKGAIVDYDKALSIDPNYTKSIGGRGTAKSYLKDMDGACADWNKAVVLGDKFYQEKIDENCLGMTKEKAIAKLKELKELLELEVITQKDYDKEKAILTPIILGKN